jgi:hypothetical protein
MIGDSWQMNNEFRDCGCFEGLGFRIAKPTWNFFDDDPSFMIEVNGSLF